MSNLKREKTDHFGMTRRSFLKATAVAGAAVTASRFIKYPKIGSSVPQKNTEPVINEKWVNTSCLNCSTRCATRVRVVNGKAVRIAGNPLSKVSEGEICPRGHIGLQVLYNENRISSPLKRTNTAKGKGTDPRWQEISWSEAMSDITSRLKSLRDGGNPHKLLIFEGLNSISNQDMIRRFAGAYGTPNLISGDGLENEAERMGRWLADGNYSHIGYEFSETNYILSFGAGITEWEKPLARNLRMWGKIRRERPNRAKIVVIDPRYSVTAAKADQWIPIKPGTDLSLAMAIANVIITEKLYNTEFIDRWSTGFNEYMKAAVGEYSPEKAATDTGIDVETIRQIAREFARSKPAVAWIGRGICGYPNSSYTAYAIFCLNALVGSIDVPGGIIYQENPAYKEMPALVEDNISRDGKKQLRFDYFRERPNPSAEAITNQIPDSIINNPPYPAEIAVGFNSNFNMAAPGTSRWDEALQKLPFYVHVSPFISEMADYADIVLPAQTFLEEWGYDHSPPGSGFAELKIKQPAVAPLDNTKSVTDIIFDLANGVGGTTASSFASIGRNAQSFVKYRTENIINFEDFKNNGVWVGPDYQYRKYDRIFNTPSKKFDFDSKESKTGPSNYKETTFLGDKGQYPLNLVTYQPLPTIENGSQNYPWAQEILLVMHGEGWMNFAEMNTETARSLGIKDKQPVWVESPYGKIKLLSRVVEGILPGVVAIATGQGHTAGGRWQKGIGVNPNDIIGVDFDRLSGQSCFFNTRVKVYKA